MFFAGHPLIAFSLLLLLALAVTGDLREHRIPNWLSLGGVAVAVGLHSVIRGADGAADALQGAAVGGLLLLPLWLLRGLAAGDVKLLAAVGAHLGPALAALAGLATLIAGGLIALLVVLRRRYRQSPGSASGAAVAADTESAARTFPYAPAIAVGSLVAGLSPFWLGALGLGALAR